MEECHKIDSCNACLLNNVSTLTTYQEETFEFALFLRNFHHVRTCTERQKLEFEL